MIRWISGFFSLFAFAAFADPAVPSVNVFVDISKKMIPSVVNISTLSTVQRRGPRQGGPDDLFRRYFEDFFNEDGEPPRREPGPPRAKRPVALGTGFIIDESGLILTNRHVVEGADEILVHFTEATDEEGTAGELVGEDPELDLALIRVKVKKSLVAVTFGDSDKLEVGEYVAAIGNPFGQGHSVTHGIISAKDRKSPDFAFAKYLQTDAPINPGNSGGPLVNLRGEVIGINNAIDARAQGIGFAIPINAVKRVLPELKTKGTVARGYIGILVNELTPEIAEQIGVSKKIKGPFIAHVYPGQPAEHAGAKAYDVIREVDGKKILNSGELIEIITQAPIGKSMKMKVLRGSKEITLEITSAERPGERVRQGGHFPPKGKPPQKKPAFDVGLELEAYSQKQLKGVLVTGVGYSSPADRAGILRGDVILEVNRKPVHQPQDFYAVVNARKSYLVRVRRTDPSGRESFTVIVLDLKPGS